MNRSISEFTEIEALVSLKHQNIVPYFGVEQDNDWCTFMPSPPCSLCWLSVLSHTPCWSQTTFQPSKADCFGYLNGFNCVLQQPSVLVWLLQVLYRDGVMRHFVGRSTECEEPARTTRCLSAADQSSRISTFSAMGTQVEALLQCALRPPPPCMSHIRHQSI